MRESYDRGTSLIGQVRWSYTGHAYADERYATHDAFHSFKTVSIRAILFCQGHCERMQISL